MGIKNTTDAVVLTSMKKVPIETVHLFEPIHEHLMVLLRSLTPEEWHQPTKSWRKKEVIHHLAIAGDPVLAEPVLDMISVMA